MTTRTTEDYPRSLRSAKEWLERFHRKSNFNRLCPCQHGHFDCSIVEDGACVDEILSQWPEIED